VYAVAVALTFRGQFLVLRWMNARVELAFFANVVDMFIVV